MVRLRLQKELRAILTLVLLLFVGNVIAKVSNLSEYQLKERKEQFAKIVDILLSVVVSFTVKGSLAGEPKSFASFTSPSSATPLTRATPSPSVTLSSTATLSPSATFLPFPRSSHAPSYSPNPSLFLKPSLLPEVPLSPNPTLILGKKDELVTSPLDTNKKPGSDEQKIIEEVTSKRPGIIYFPGVPYAIFMHEAQNGRAKKSAVILIHDIDGEAQDMVPMINAIQKGGFPETRFVIPETNKKIVKTVRPKASTWFHLPETKMEKPTDKESYRTVVGYINEIGDHLAQGGIDRRKIVLIGHGQGSALALMSYLRHQWGGILGVAGFPSIQAPLPTVLSEANNTSPVVLVSGDQDEHIPAGSMKYTASKLEEIGRDVSYVKIEGVGHDILLNEKVLALAVGLLNRVFATQHE